jgi:cell division protein FtsL
VLTALGLFAVVVVHVVLAQQQFQLAALSSRITSARAVNDQLRLQVAQLQAPERVVSDAQKQLGMVSPPSITYLVPGHHGALVRAQPAGSPTTVPAANPTTSTTATTKP